MGNTKVWGISITGELILMKKQEGIILQHKGNLARIIKLGTGRI